MATLCAEFEAPDSAGCTPLMYAVTGKDLERVRVLVTRVDVNTQDRDGKTALHHAAVGGQPRMVKALLQQKASINVRDKDGATALFYAAMCGYEDVVRLLVANRADVSAADRHGRTAQGAARRSGYPRIVHLLRR
jgi:ankyrin repeat protein